MYLYCLFFTEVKGSTYTKDSAALTLKGIATIEHTIVICLTSAITAAWLVFSMGLIDLFGIGSKYVCLGLFVFFGDFGDFGDFGAVLVSIVLNDVDVEIVVFVHVPVHVPLFLLTLHLFVTWLF